MTASNLTTGLFVLLVVIMAGVVGRIAYRAPLRAGGAPGGATAVAVLLVLYLLVPAGLAVTGRLDRYHPLPAPALLLLGGLAVITTVLAFSPAGARLASSLPLAALIGYQAFRIPVELLLHRLSLEGAVPVQMTYTGRNWDIVTGVTALLLGWWLSRSQPRPPGAGLLLAWNVLGLALLVNIVSVAILSTPTAFRYFTEGPPNLLPSTFPFVWLPSFLVQLALFGHLILFRRLAHGTEAGG